MSYCVAYDISLYCLGNLWNREFFLKLHHQCFVFITLWIYCYNLTPPATCKLVWSIHLGSVAMSWTCTLWTGNYWLYSHVSNEIILVSHLIKSWHQPLCFAGRVLLSVYVCFESNKNVLLGGGLFFPLWCILFVSCCTSCKNIKHVTSYH